MKSFLLALQADDIFQKCLNYNQLNYKKLFRKEELIEKLFRNYIRIAILE